MRYSGGYNIYLEPKSLKFISWLPAGIRKGLASFAERLPEHMKGRGYLMRAAHPVNERYIGNAYIFRTEEKERIFKRKIKEEPGELLSETYDAIGNLSESEQMQSIDLKYWLPGDILQKADKMSMAHSLELRVPFLVSELIGCLKLDRRRDEIGDLSKNYMQMLHVTKEQFEKIQRDKEHILKLWKSRQEFYNNVTHELKTPLTTISGYAQLIEQDGLADKELFSNGMEHILKESTRLHDMVMCLLEMQDKENLLEVTCLDLTEILKSVAETMQIKAGRYGSKLVLEGEQVSYLIRGREDKIRQVLINVIDNAVKYGEPKEVIRLKIHRKEDMTRISVSNRGQGIKEEDIDNIFEPFYRADKKRGRELGSSGLGLAISKKIMEEHGGSIRAESEPGGDTVFTVSFPAMERMKEVGQKDDEKAI